MAKPNLFIGAIHQQVCVEIEKQCGGQVLAHLIHPDPRAGRAPFIEIRAANEFPIDFEVEIEQRWPNVEFEIREYMGEEDL